MSRSAAPVGASGFPAGWYGKIPVTGDFIGRRLSAAFRETWHGWLHEALQSAGRQLGNRWRDDFLSMPVWRFVLSPGLAAPAGYAGLLLPSVDAVGRCFPLTIASTLSTDGVDPVRTLFASQRWFEDMEKIALSGIEATAELEALDAAIAARPFPAQGLRRREASHDRTCSENSRTVCIPLPSSPATSEASAEVRAAAGRLPGSRAAWLAEPSEITGRSLVLCDELPAGERLCAMMNGRWLEHGWTCEPMGDR